MIKEITIGEQTVLMAANAATPIRYKMLFKKDLLAEFQNAEADNSRVSDMIPELAYIMAMQAGHENLSGKTFEDYIEWLEQFGPLDLLNAGGEIAALYIENTQETSTPKKK
jgi:hypothetical protein